MTSDTFELTQPDRAVLIHDLRVAAGTFDDEAVRAAGLGLSAVAQICQRQAAQARKLATGWKTPITSALATASNRTPIPERVTTPAIRPRVATGACFLAAPALRWKHQAPRRPTTVTPFRVWVPIPQLGHDFPREDAASTCWQLALEYGLAESDARSIRDKMKKAW